VILTLWRCSSAANTARCSAPAQACAYWD
jgi:hypothetical protein